MQTYSESGGRVPVPPPQTARQHLTKAIADHVDYDPTADGLARSVCAAALLAVCGLSLLVLPIWSGFSPNRERDWQSRMSAQVETLRSDVKQFSLLLQSSTASLERRQLEYAADREKLFAGLAAIEPALRQVRDGLFRLRTDLRRSLTATTATPPK